eukprot:CAMPEP_0177644412 /NCGR_PEP_ID=MMETSP0447-20121125/8677_1 /TAXON_ID=0 /ORGANISM="Stygamoeba regulata, Strain BSH-02190019" /LENGTH=201 /DNA_ID=CAMNT_0019146777 /DNA_START=93 /DNA_END=698 /DNA_ORIENTATION=-
MPRFCVYTKKEWKPVTKAAKKEDKAPKTKFYPAEDVARPYKKKFRKNSHVPKLRGSITPGTVLILLAGRFRGKRVVFLKQLDSGLLLVTGPHKLNGVPFRRVNQAYVIATSTKVDLSGVEVPAAVNDAFFARPRKVQKKKTEEEFFATEKKKEPINPARKEAQVALDKQVLAKIKATPKLAEYLHARFSLSNGQLPHRMKF